LRVSREHLDYVVVQAIVELALKRPRKLAVLDFAGTEKEDVGMDFHAFRLKTNLHFDAIDRGGSVSTPAPARG
jgi:hypothetical protein